MRKDILQIQQPDSDPFGLRRFDFRTRIPEESEMFTPEEAKLYIHGCDYPESVDDLLLAWEIEQRFGSLSDEVILDTMCGPGKLGRELLNLGARHVVFHDGDPIMINHSREEASKIIGKGQKVHFITLPVDQIPLRDFFDLVVCHNSTHQLESNEKLKKVMERFVRLTKPGGFIVIADYQRDTAPEFLAALEERLKWTKPKIVPLLIPTFQAAFSKEEFERILGLMQSIKSWSVTDARLPNLTPEMQARIDEDPVRGHVLDYSPISLRVIVQKEEI